MKSHIFCRILAAISLSFAASNLYAAVIAQDDFEAGADPKIWVGFSYVSVADMLADTGRAGKGLKFAYVGNSDTTVDADAEARFDLGAIYKEIVIEYDLFIPANYSQVKPIDNADNNKFFRLWQVTYGDITTGNQCGASTISGLAGGSIVGTDYQMHPGWSTSTAIVQGNLITAADLGKWHTIKIWVKSGTNLGDLGFIKIYKDGLNIVDDNGLPVVNAGVQGWRYGYLFGYANSGFRQNTTLYVDNVKFSDAGMSPPNPPVPTMH